MENLLNIIPHDELFYAVVGVFLPSIIGLFAYVKTQKEEVLAKLSQVKLHVAEALDYAEDAVEGLLEGLGPESAEGNKLTDEEKAESLAMAAKALMELKKAKGVLLGE